MVSPLQNIISRVPAKSTALQPMLWLIGLILGSITTVAVTTITTIEQKSDPPFWILFLLGTLVVGFFIVLWRVLVSYEYLLKNDRDALRSEYFALRKMEIEKGQVGDDRSGLKDWEEIENKINGSEALPIEEENTP